MNLLYGFNFLNSKASTNTQAKNQHLYSAKFEHTWTPIQPISKEIQIGVNSSHLMTRMQFPVQLDVTHTIHRL
jgi:hypothetical protein